MGRAIPLSPSGHPWSVLGWILPFTVNFLCIWHNWGGILFKDLGDIFFITCILQKYCKWTPFIQQGTFLTRNDMLLCTRHNTCFSSRLVFQCYLEEEFRSRLATLNWADNSLCWGTPLVQCSASSTSASQNVKEQKPVLLSKIFLVICCFFFTLSQFLLQTVKC